MVSVPELECNPMNLTTNIHLIYLPPAVKQSESTNQRSVMDAVDLAKSLSSCKFCLVSISWMVELG